MHKSPVLTKKNKLNLAQEITTFKKKVTFERG